jgi:DNA-binding NarL/FixJ family response regulator
LNRSREPRAAPSPAPGAIRVAIAGPATVRARVAALLDAPSAPRGIVVVAREERDALLAAHLAAAGAEVLILHAEPSDAEALASIGEVGARTGVATVVLSGAGAAGVGALLRAGARGVLSLEAGTPQVAAAVEAAAAGLVVLPAGAIPDAMISGAQTAPRAGRRAAVPGDTPTLTPREREILALMADGLGNKAIAPRLGISAHTVKFHIASIFAKLGVTTRAEAVAEGARRGLLLL